MSTEKFPIHKVDRWHFRINNRMTACCRLETFIDPKGRYSILVTERGDNPGLNVTDAHDVLRDEIVRWLQLPKSQKFRFYEAYDSQSYVPPRSGHDWGEVCLVTYRDDKPHWQYVTDEEWAAIYIDPQREKPTVKRRPAEKEVSNGS